MVVSLDDSSRKPYQVKAGQHQGWGASGIICIDGIDNDSPVFYRLAP